MVRSATRYARTVRQPSLVLQELNEAGARAFGEGGEPRSGSLDFPTDTLRDEFPHALLLDEHFQRKTYLIVLPDPAVVERAADIIWSARKPLVITGRGARRAGPELVRFLDKLGAAYLVLIPAKVADSSQTLTQV